MQKQKLSTYHPIQGGAAKFFNTQNPPKKLLDQVRDAIREPLQLHIQ